MLNRARRIARVVKVGGPWALARTFNRHLYEKCSEGWLRIASEKRIRIPGLHDRTRNFGCESMDYRSLRRVFKYLKPQENRDVFLDFGSGLGRAVIVAATFSFRRAIGVEISSELNRVAERNVVRARARGRLKCRIIEIVAQDACSYSIPSDVTVVYMFSPFGETVISKVLDNIKVSISEVPRKLRIVFANPRIFEIVSHDCDWLVLQWEFRRWDNMRVAVYLADPERV